MRRSTRRTSPAEDAGDDALEDGSENAGSEDEEGGGYNTTLAFKLGTQIIVQDNGGVVQHIYKIELRFWDETNVYRDAENLPVRSSKFNDCI